jgi:hypothetical protein
MTAETAAAITPKEDYTKDTADNIWRCAEALEEISSALTRIADLFEECTPILSQGHGGDDRRAVRTIPLTD